MLGAWLVHQFRLPVSWTPRLPAFGALRHRDEFLNIQDNFLQGKLRYDRLEAALRAADEPVVVDLGINVGITVRWWFALNPHSRVVAVDMMAEAHAWAARQLEAWRPGAAARVTFVERIVGPATGVAEVVFDDPMAGTNRSDATTGAIHRTLPVTTLDAMPEIPSGEILLLKVDIEGAGARALAGAPGVLRRTRFVVAEFHDADECAMMTRLSLEAGLSLVRANDKMLFFARA
jgi:FkbM family methyltransferase